MIENKFILPVFSVIVLFAILFLLHYFYNSQDGLNESFAVTSQDFWQNNRLKLHANETQAFQHSFFPKEVHQMWKSNSLPPIETLRWRAGCQALNPFHDFNLMDDDDLKAFVHGFYPQYAPLFDSLKGVYMADMARFIVAYHYGGLYMDLDFYCHRPFFCLEDFVLREVNRLLNTANNTSMNEVKDLLVVSREPLIQARFIHHNNRTVIQDFILASPRHPFLRWLLDSRSAAFAADSNYAHKGPFSYNIDKALDEYYHLAQADLVQELGTSLATISVNNDEEQASKRVLSSKSSTKQSNLEKPSKKKAYILEMEAEILHPLIDATNSRIAEGCRLLLASSPSSLSLEGKDPMDRILRKRCSAFERGRYLSPVAETVLVHMWTHTFLGKSLSSN